VASLWLLVALSALGIELSLQARNRRLAAANVVEGTQARAAASAGVEQARARLAQRLRFGSLSGSSAVPPLEPATIMDPWRTLPAVLPETLTIGGTRVHVALTDANASLNLNRAGEGELRRLFVAIRVDAGDADRIAQAVADWRDADDLVRPRGAERAQYRHDGLDTEPANAPFWTVDELRLVRGVTEEVYAKVRPYLTVAGTGMVNLNLAPQPVLLALDGMTEEAAWALRRAADAGRPMRSLDELQLILTPGARAAMQATLPTLLARAVFETREVEVTSSAWMDGSPVRARATGLAVRAGRSVFLVGRRSE
jgi:general secretion pathway protein K